MKYSELDNKQKKRLFFVLSPICIIGVLLLVMFTTSLLNEKQHGHDKWAENLMDSPEQAERVNELSKDAIKVSVGTYLENIRELNIKGSSFRAEMEVWFNWEGDESLDPANHFRVYKGVINKSNIISEYHENGKNYQLLRLDVTVSKNFDTKRFPLESHQLRIYIEGEYPVQDVLFVADVENSGINKNLAISGFKFLRSAVGNTTFQYQSNNGDPRLNDPIMTSEVVTALEINRASYGMYFKCFVALVGTISWVLIALFICTYHHVDPIGMLPGALFGTVGNIMVGASLVPDSLEMGLLEYVNIWGILTIIAVTFATININRIRTRYEDKDFAHYLGRYSFYVILVLTIVGNIVLPYSAYIK